jgi:hypothetical protein
MPSAELSKHLTAYRKGYEQEVLYLNGEHPGHPQPTITQDWLARRVFTRSRTLHEGRVEAKDIAAWEGGTQAVRDKLLKIRREEIARQVEEAKAEAERLRAAHAEQLEAQRQEARDRDAYEKGLAQGRRMINDAPADYGLPYVQAVLEVRGEYTDPSAHSRGFTQAYLERQAELLAVQAQRTETAQRAFGHDFSYPVPNLRTCPTCGVTS